MIPDTALIPAGDERLLMFLSILEAVGGTSDASDYSNNWVNAFCEPYEGLETETFNHAIGRGHTQVTHDTCNGMSTVYLTNDGRAFLQAAREAEQAVGYS